MARSITAPIHRYLTRCPALAKVIKFHRDRKGLAAVEFAMIVPIMISLFMGSFEFSQALTVDRRVTATASAAADLVAQTDSLDTSDLNDIFALSNTILYPYNTSSLRMVVTSVKADAQNDTTVDWSQGYNGGSAYAEGGDFDLPDGLTQPFACVVVAEIEYTYTSPLSYYITGPITFTDIYYLRPRKSLCVEKT